MESKDKSLTPKQEAFALAYIETQDASAAYRRAYDAKKMAAATIWREASLLLKHPMVSARIKELRAPVAAKVQISLELHLTDLKRLRDAALAAGKYSAAIQAEIARGKASGLYVERIEQTSGDVGFRQYQLANEAAAELTRRLQEDLRKRASAAPSTPDVQ